MKELSWSVYPGPLYLTHAQLQMGSMARSRFDFAWSCKCGECSLVEIKAS